MSSMDKRAVAKIYYSRGVASLPTILVVVFLILVVAISISVLAFNESSSSSSQSNTVSAQQYAEAGARDALEQIAINKAYSVPTSTPYAISFVADGCNASSTRGCAEVSVVNGTGYGTALNPILITSVGTVDSNSIEVQVNVILDPSLYGQIATTTWKETSL